MEKSKIAIDIDETIIFHPEVREMKNDDIGKWFDRHDVYDHKDANAIDYLGLKLLSFDFDIHFVSKCYLSHLESKKKFIGRMSIPNHIELFEPKFVDFGIDYESEYDKIHGITPGHDTGKGHLDWASIFVDDSMFNLSCSKVDNLYLVKPSEFEPSKAYIGFLDKPWVLEDGRPVVVVDSMMGVYQHIMNKIELL